MSRLAWLGLTVAACAPTGSGTDTGGGDVVPDQCPDVAWKDVSTGTGRTCGVHVDGCIECWGGCLPDRL
jgi:hypothetical protein